MEQFAENLKSLSDPTRLRILALLDYGELCVCDLMESLQLPQSRVSRHTSFLRKGGWVNARRKGKWVYYSLAAQEEAMFAEVLDTLRRSLPNTVQGREDRVRLDAYLKTKNADSCGS